MYHVRTITNSHEIETCERFEICHYLWNSKKEPKAYGWMGYIPGTGLFVKMICEESDPKRVYHSHKDPVYKDSAMEIFLAFPEGELTNECMYTNFEINSNGAMLANFGKGRPNRQYITEEQYAQTGVKAWIEEDKWGLEVLFPESYLMQICDFEQIKQGKMFYCNFYKIEEAEEGLHFGAYSPIDSEKPNFHLPVYFSKAGITSQDNCQGYREVIQNFQCDGVAKTATRHGSGHINDTYRITLEKEDGTKSRVTLQKINKSVFTKPEEVMENITGVTTFLKRKIIENGGNPDRETLTVIPAKDGKSYFVDSKGQYWRCYGFIEDTIEYDQVMTPEDFYQSALAFGNFQRLLTDYPAETLYETIEGFHDTKARFEVFKKAVAEDVCGRAASVREEIDFVLAHEDIAHVFGDMLSKGELPIRVTHNDTKLNNVLIDMETHKGICVIDLDTVMPGLAMNDFGDAIRFGASTAAEDEQDLDKVRCDMELYEIYVKGFMEGCGKGLTKKEIQLLPMGAKVMTFECGMRFLTDYLQGDTYFRIHREHQNLDRCRTQFKLVADMESKWDVMNEIVQKYI